MRIRQIRDCFKVGLIILTLVISLYLPVLPVSAAGSAVVTVSAPTQPVSHG